MKQNYSYHKIENGRPLKLWDSHGPFEEQAMRQLGNIAKLPFIHQHIAGMPDVHLGIGATVGSVIATKGAIIPAAVGVDIGCGMQAVMTNLLAEDLGNLANIRSKIEETIPHGRSDNGGVSDKGAWCPYGIPKIVENAWIQLLPRYQEIIERYPKAKGHKDVEQLGTLGGGNHFIEICLDESDRVWIMLHTGSRSPGNRIGQYFIEAAKREMEKYHITDYLADKDLSYLVEHTEIFNGYVEAVHWAQRYASANREIMMKMIINVLKNNVKKEFIVMDSIIDCHHNYIGHENHFGKNVWVTRKGAVRARKGDMGIIPGSMGTGSFIVEGLGNKDSFHSCSHGAGRVMSRTQAKNLITPERHAERMNGIEARLDDDVLDESPDAYKDIEGVMKAQNDLVIIKHRLRQIINIKG